MTHEQNDQKNLELAALAFGSLNAPAFSEQDIPLLAGYVDSILEAQTHLEKQKAWNQVKPEHLSKVVEMLGIHTRMSQKNGTEWKEIPEALQAVVERSLSISDRKPKKQSITIRLSESGLRVLQSMLDSLEMKTALSMQTRRKQVESEIPVRETSVHLSGNAGNGIIEYNVHRTGEKDIQLSVRLQDVAGQYTIKLSQNGRVMDTRTSSGKDSTVNFERLVPGHYEVELKGHYAQSIEVDILAS